jgi:hypothetical protein
MVQYIISKVLYTRIKYKNIEIEKYDNNKYSKKPSFKIEN